MRIHQEPLGSPLSFDQFFVGFTENRTYRLAAWLQPFIDYSNTGHKSVPPYMTSREAQPVIKDAVLATLDECAGHKIHTRSKPPRWLHDINKAEPPMMRGLEPRYWTPQPTTQSADLGPFCFDHKDKPGGVPWKDRTSKKISAQQSASSKLSNRDPGDATSASGFNGEQVWKPQVTKKQVISAKEDADQPDSAPSEVKPRSELDQQDITGHNTDLSENNKNAAITSTNDCHRQENKNTSSSRVGLSKSCTDSSAEVNAYPGTAVRDSIGKSHAAENSTERPSNNAHAVLQPFATEFERLLLQPVREKAANEIAEHLQKWRDGWIDLSGFETRIERSLSDVRVSIRMQRALVQSDAKAPVSNAGQKNDAAENRKKRSRSQSDGTCAAVQRTARRSRHV